MTVNIKNYPDKNKRDVGEPWPFVKVPRVPFAKVPRVPVEKDD